MSTSIGLRRGEVEDTSKEAEIAERTEEVKQPAKNEETTEITEAVDQSQTTPEAEVKDVPVVEPAKTEEVKEPIHQGEIPTEPEIVHSTQTTSETIEMKDVPVVEPTETEDAEASTRTEETPETQETADQTQTAPEEVKELPVVEPTEIQDAEASTRREEIPENQETANQTQTATEEVKDIPVVEAADSFGSFRIFDFTFLLVSMIVVVVAINYLEIFSSNKPKVFTKEQLATFDGSDGLPLYVAILGEIYDVSNGDKYYGKGKGYHCFVAKDGTRAYITGEFVKDLTDDVSDFNAEKRGGLAEWRQFYRDHEEYAFVGLLIGAFYDEHGQPTDVLKAVENGAQQAERIKEMRAEAKKLHPNCNSKWAQGKGGQVWCNEGYPRLTVESFPGATEKKRCACFKETDHSYQRQLYENCEPDATRCIIPPKDKEKEEKKKKT